AAAAADRAVQQQPVRAPQVVQVNGAVMLVESRTGARQKLVTYPVNVNESWLLKAWWRRWITQRQFDAGMLLRGLHERSSLHALRAIDLDRIRVDGGMAQASPSPERLDAARRYAAAVAALDTADFPCGRIVAAIAVEGLSAKRLEQRYRWRHGTGLGHART